MKPNSSATHVERRNQGSSKIYFSCPKFTVLLAMEGPVIVKAAPVVKAFEGQTIGALTSWVWSKFGGPIRVEKIPGSVRLETAGRGFCEA